MLYVIIYVDESSLFFLMIRRPPRSTQNRSSAASAVYNRQSTVLVNLKQLLWRLKGKLVHFFIDNTTAISCIKKGGSNGSYTCNEVTELIYRYAWKKGITFKLSYCPTKLNVRADRASRAFACSAEWMLSPDTRNHIFSYLHTPSIDLFLYLIHI